MKLSLLVLLLVVFFSMVAHAQVRSGGAFASLVEGAVALDTSGVEVQAAAVVDGGKGLFITYIAPNISEASKLYCFTVDAASHFDASINVITPTYVFGDIPLTSVVRTGVDSDGNLPAAGCWANGYRPIHTAQYPLFIPPGKIFTVRALAVNTGVDVVIGFVEAQR